MSIFFQARHCPAKWLSSACPSWSHARPPWAKRCWYSVVSDTDIEKATPFVHTYSKALVYCLPCSRIPNRNVHIVDCQLKHLTCKLVSYREFAAQRLAPESFLCWAHHMVTSHSSCSRARLGEVWTKGEKTKPVIVSKEKNRQIRCKAAVRDHWSPLSCFRVTTRITFLCMDSSPFAIQERLILFLKNILDFPNEEASENDLCSPSPEHPNLKYFDKSIKFLELELKEGISQGKNWHSVFSLLPVFPLQIISTTTRFKPVLEFFSIHCTKILQFEYIKETILSLKLCSTFSVLLAWDFSSKR